MKASEDALRVVDGACDQMTGLSKALYRGGVGLLMFAHESLMMEGVYIKEYVDGARDCFDRLMREKRVQGIPDDVVHLRQQVETLELFEDATHGYPSEEKKDTKEEKAETPKEKNAQQEIGVGVEQYSTAKGQM